MTINLLMMGVWKTLLCVYAMINKYHPLSVKVATRDYLANS
jgi:hypothetical protein